MYYQTLIQNRHFQDLNPLLFGYDSCLPGHLFGPVVRDYWMLFYVDSGQGLFTSDEQSIRVEKNHIFVVRPGASTILKNDTNDTWCIHWIGFTGNLSERFRNLPLCFPFQTDLFSKMEQAESYEDDKEAFLYGYLLLLYCELFQQKPKNSYISKAKLLLQQHCMDGTSVESVADNLNLDRRYLARLFLRETGVTMCRFRLEARMHHATYMLKLGYSCSQVAEMTGYTDYANFSRAFKQVFGFSPSQSKKR